MRETKKFKGYRANKTHTPRRAKGSTSVMGLCRFALVGYQDQTRYGSTWTMARVRCANHCAVHGDEVLSVYANHFEAGLDH